MFSAINGGGIYIILSTPKSQWNLWKRDQKDWKSPRNGKSAMKGCLLNIGWFGWGICPYRFTYVNIWSPASDTIWEDHRTLNRKRHAGEIQNWRQNLRFYSLVSHVLYICGACVHMKCDQPVSGSCFPAFPACDHICLTMMECIYPRTVS